LGWPDTQEAETGEWQFKVSLRKVSRKPYLKNNTSEGMA
jgi:hypothetical protein